MGDYVLARRGGALIIAAAVDPSAPGPEFELDARLLPMTLSAQQIRHLPFTKGVSQLTETSWTGWPIMGPRT
eukprot:9021435-Pyramimonas_sp.AAC.1